MYEGEGTTCGRSTVHGGRLIIIFQNQLEETIKLIESTVGAVPFNLIPMMVDSNDKARFICYPSGLLLCTYSPSACNRIYQQPMTQPPTKPKPCLKTRSFLQNRSKVLNMSKKFDQSESSLVPIFLTSSVTGEGLDLLTSFLNYLPTKKKDEFERQRPVQFQIDNFWYQNEHSKMKKPRPRKTVKIHGRLLSGIIKQNETLRIGPDFSGKFYDTKIESIKVLTS